MKTLWMFYLVYNLMWFMHSKSMMKFHAFDDFYGQQTCRRQEYCQSNSQYSCTMYDCEYIHIYMARIHFCLIITIDYHSNRLPRMPVRRFTGSFWIIRANDQWLASNIVTLNQWSCGKDIRQFSWSNVLNSMRDCKSCSGVKTERHCTLSCKKVDCITHKALSYYCLPDRIHIDILRNIIYTHRDVAT